MRRARLFGKNTTQKRFTALVEQQAPGLYRLAYARLGNRHDAEDVLQATFLKAYRNFGTFKEGTNAQCWLATILINTVRDHIRVLKRLPAITSTDDETLDQSALEDTAAADPSQALIDQEIDPQLQKALQTLPEVFLAPVLLRDLHDLTYQEIARVLDVPIGTVMSRLSRGRRLLREKLKGSTLSRDGVATSSANAGTSAGGRSNEVR